jgi:hypothetical protein
MAVLHRGRLQAFGRPRQLADELFDGIGAALDLGGPAPAEVLDRLRSLPGVHQADPGPSGAVLRVADREVLPVLVEGLVADGRRVYGVAGHAPTLEDVYFAVEARILAQEGGEVTDGFYRRDDREAVPSGSLLVDGSDGGLGAAAAGGDGSGR